MCARPMVRLHGRFIGHANQVQSLLFILSHAASIYIFEMSVQANIPHMGDVQIEVIRKNSPNVFRSPLY